MNSFQNPTEFLDFLARNPGRNNNYWSKEFSKLSLKPLILITET